MSGVHESTKFSTKFSTAVDLELDRPRGARVLSAQCPVLQCTRYGTRLPLRYTSTAGTCTKFSTHSCVHLLNLVLSYVQRRSSTRTAVLQASAKRPRGALLLEASYFRQFSPLLSSESR